MYRRPRCSLSFPRTCATRGPSAGAGLVATILAVLAAGCGAEPPSAGPIATTHGSDPPTASTGATPELVDGLFPVTKTVDADGKPVELHLTGTALRKALGLSFYRIAAYAAECPTAVDADTLIAADVRKELELVMVRNISATILEKSFAKALADNDPEGKFAAESRKLLDHMLAQPMDKGQRVVISHHPGRGMSCRVGDGAAMHVDDVAFAQVVWSIYMGPRAVSPDLRAGLAARLTKGS